MYLTKLYQRSYTYVLSFALGKNVSMTDAADDYITVEEASALLGVKKATLYAYVSRGLVHSYKQGIRRQRLYRRSELEQLLTVRPGLAVAEIAAAPGVDEADLPPAADWMVRR